MRTTRPKQRRSRVRLCLLFECILVWLSRCDNIWCLCIQRVMRQLGFFQWDIWNLNEDKVCSTVPIPPFSRTVTGLCWPLTYLQWVTLSDLLTVSDSLLRPLVTNVNPWVSIATPVLWTCSSTYLKWFQLILGHGQLIPWMADRPMSSKKLR